MELYKTWTTQYKDGLLRPQSRFNTRDVIAQYTFDEIYVKHAEIQQAIFDRLEKILAENNLILLKVDLLDIRRAAE